MTSVDGGADGSSGRHIVVVGPTGAGKTTVGRLLAEQLGVRFVDNDEQLRRQSGPPPPTTSYATAAPGCTAPSSTCSASPSGRRRRR